VCGIAGFVAPPGTTADPAVLARMIAELRHRGPDTVGYHVEGRVALGAARLRVIDLETGDQPIGNEDGTIHAVLNGEIYNFPALRAALAAGGHLMATRSDTEVVVHGWEDSGERCVEAFNGMFALALWDRRREQLFLARDRMGEKPLYYAAVAGGLIFGSELRALLAHPRVSRELDLASVSRYLAYDFVPDPHSMIRGVSKLPPAHWLTASGGRVSVRPYWRLAFAPEPRVDARQWSDEIRRRFDAAVRARLLSDVPLGCFLSGGIDSTAVAATAARFRPGLRTFSVGYADRAYDERPFARLAARRLGTCHEELVVSADDVAGILPRLGALLDEPIADVSFVPLHLLSRAAKAAVTVALTGDGGDELFAGYPTMAAEWWHERFARLPSRLRGLLQGLAAHLPPAADPLREFLGALEYPREARNQALLGGLPPARQGALFTPAARAALGGFDAYDEIADVLDGCDTPDAVARLIYRYCKLYLAGQNLANADRASMAAGLELRAPFLDHTFVEFTGRIPPALRLRGLARYKPLLKQAFADRLPPEILARGKQGFGAPMAAWLREPLLPILRDVLAPERLRAGGLFEPGVIQRSITEHVDGARDRHKLLWSLLTLELWRTHHLGERGG
jgi:asparagine synthase (glutamine-hydrolysing)